MKKTTILLLAFVSSLFFQIQAQISYTNLITNPSFETGNATGRTWTRATGYTWLGTNTEGDATKDGSYVNGVWNSSIGDVECSLTITGLPAGYYKITALATVSFNRSNNQRLFVTSGTTTKSTLFGASSNPAYTAANLNILDTTETYSFGGYSESVAENGPFNKLSLVTQVTDGTLKIGFRESGKSLTLGNILIIPLRRMQASLNSTT